MLNVSDDPPYFKNLIFFAVKGIDRPFVLRGECRLIRSVITNWMLGKFFLSHFKGSSSQDQQKTLGCRLITSKVTLTGKSHFMLIFLTPFGHFTKLHQLPNVDGCDLMKFGGFFRH